MTDEWGWARSYAKLEGGLNFDRYIEQIRNGRSYVSDGKSHVIDFSVDGHELGTRDSEVRLDRPRKITVTAKVGAYLPQENESFTLSHFPVWLAYRLPMNKSSPAWRDLRNWFSGDRLPYWHIERARIGETRMVPVELVVNGEAVARIEIIADGNWNEIAFDWFVDRSSWLALRILAQFPYKSFLCNVGRPALSAPSVESAKWCREAVDWCWEMKRTGIREEDLRAASAAYDSARETYDLILSEAIRTSSGSAHLWNSGAKSFKGSKNTVR